MPHIHVAPAKALGGELDRLVLLVTAEMARALSARMSEGDRP